MSVDIFVLSNAPPPIFETWQEAAATLLNVDLRFTGSGPASAHGGGILPVTIGDLRTGFEFSTDEDDAFWSYHPEVPGLRGWSYIAKFKTGSRAHKFASSMIAAVSLCELQAGLVFDPQSTQTWDAVQSGELLSDVLNYFPIPGIAR